jgi:hypothetical protein
VVLRGFPFANASNPVQEKLGQRAIAAVLAPQQAAVSDLSDDPK